MGHGTRFYLSLVLYLPLQREEHGGYIWTLIGTHLGILRPISGTFWLTNVLKSQICPFGAALAHFGPKSDIMRL